MNALSGHDKGILLEAGTNELELLVFSVAGQRFGVNVAKVREILPVPEITATPGCADEVEGVVVIRDLVVPIASLEKCLYPDSPTADPKPDDQLLLLEYNQNYLSFRVNSVERIYRISWTEVLPPNLSENAVAITAVVLLNDSIVPILDFESLSVELGILSFTEDQSEGNAIGGKDRSEFPIVFADDSAVIRKLVQRKLEDAGYTNIQAFNDGEAAWNYLSGVVENTSPEELPNRIAGVITDIEMPRLDGLSLTKKLRQTPALKDLPVILFSSIASKANRNKAEQVGASAQISKPESGKLAEMLTELLGAAVGV